MTILATLRHQQRTRARTVLGLLVVVWLNLTLQACAVSAPVDESPADRTVVTNTLDLTHAHSDHALPEHRQFCPGCEHDGCTEHGACDSSVAAGTKAELRQPDTNQFDPIAAAVGNDLEVLFNSEITSPNKYRSCCVTAAAVSLNIQYCVYLI